MTKQHRKYILAILALYEAGKKFTKSDCEEMAMSLSPAGSDELADTLMLIKLHLSALEDALRVAGQVGLQVKDLAK